jgi:hypothetical protein
LSESTDSADVSAAVGRFDAGTAKILINAMVELKQNRAMEPPLLMATATALRTLRPVVGRRQISTVFYLRKTGC